MPAPEVRTYNGVPPVNAFGANLGTPIVINTATGIAYFLGPGDVVTAIVGGGGAGTGTVTHGTGPIVNHALTAGSGVTVDDIKSLALLTDGQLMVGATGADPAPQTMSGDATLSSLGVLTLNPLTVMTRGKVQAGFQMPMSY